MSPSPTLIEPLRIALSEQFLSVQHQLCIFHVKKNMVANIKAKWSQNQAKDMVNDTDEAVTPPLFPINKLDIVRNLNQSIHDDIQISDVGSRNTTQLVQLLDPRNTQDIMADAYKLWEVMVYTTNEVKLEKSWQRFNILFGHWKSLVDYLEKHYMPFKTEWAGPWISQYKNFGQQMTSPTEASPQQLKTYLVNGTSHLYQIHSMILVMLDSKADDFKKKAETQKV